MNERAFEVHREDIKQYMRFRVYHWTELRTNKQFQEAFERMNEQLPYPLNMDEIGFTTNSDTELYICGDLLKQYKTVTTNDRYGTRFKKKTANYNATKELTEIVGKYFRDYNPWLLIELFGNGSVKKIYISKSQDRYFLICNKVNAYGGDLKIPQGVTEIKMSEYYKVREDDGNEN